MATFIKKGAELNMMGIYLTIIFLVGVNLQNGKCKGHKNDIENEDPVDKIMRERGLYPPHEVKMMSQADKKCRSNEKFYTENDEIKYLKNELGECNKGRKTLQETLVQNVVNESLQSMPRDIPYLKQIYQGILRVWRKADRSTEFVKDIRFQFGNDSIGTLEACLDDGETVEKCVDIILSILKTGKEEIPSNFVNQIINILERVDFTVLGYVIIAIMVLAVSVYSVFLLMASKHHFLGLLITLIWTSLIVSVPWEWMRLYKEAIASKTATKMLTSSECFKEKMSYLSLVKYWLQDSFSFSDNECLKYFNAEIIDPFWEVTPGQALAASASRIFFQPMLVIADYIGKCFKLMFKEIPIQWQLPVFIVLFIVILFAIGVEINGPLLQIGRHKQVFRQELEIKKNRIKELEKQLDDVKRKDLQTIQNGVHPQIVQGSAGGSMVEDVPDNSQNILQRAVEHSYLGESRIGGIGLNVNRCNSVVNEQHSYSSESQIGGTGLSVNRCNNGRNEQYNEIVVQETETFGFTQ